MNKLQPTEDRFIVHLRTTMEVTHNDFNESDGVNEVVLVSGRNGILRLSYPPDDQDLSDLFRVGSAVDVDAAIQR